MGKKYHYDEDGLFVLHNGNERIVCNQYSNVVIGSYSWV